MRKRKDVVALAIVASIQRLCLIIYDQQPPHPADFRISGGKEEFEGVGSGLVWDTRGHIATNYHCVARLAADRSGKQVTRVGVLQPGQTKLLELDATIVGTDPSRDLAVVKVDAPPGLLRPISVGTSADLRVGQTVYAIGNPSGYLHTLSAGVLSGKGRAIPSPAGTRIVGCLQTDANINAGNSGGALLDSRGRLIGMNTATFTRKGTGELHRPRQAWGGSRAAIARAGGLSSPGEDSRGAREGTGGAKGAGRD